MPDANDVAIAQTEAVVRLYDTAIKHIEISMDHAASGDLEGQVNEITAAVRIFTGLDESLDLDVGGQVAQNLHEMYQAVNKTLLSSIGQENAAEIGQKMIGSVKKLRNSWAEIAKLDPIP